MSDAGPGSDTPVAPPMPDVVGSSGRGDGAPPLISPAAVPEARKSLGLWADTWRRLRRNKLALVGLAIIIVFMLVGLSQIIASLAHIQLTPYDPNGVNYSLSPKGIGVGPSWHHPFGTDYLGRDILSRTIVASRISMLVGVIAVAIALVIGLAICLSACWAFLQ